MVIHITFDDDGDYIVFEPVHGKYGVGQTLTDAIVMFTDSLITYYHTVATYAEQGHHEDVVLLRQLDDYYKQVSN